MNSSLARKIVPAVAVGKIINCTGREMYVYGTSGMLLRLSPRKFDLSKVKLSSRDVFYVVDEMTEEQLLGIDQKFARIILHPNFYGNGREGENIYKFSLNQILAIPITDQYGRNGDKVYR